VLHFDLRQYEEFFQNNYSDWCAGGPRDEGWTRGGELVNKVEASLGLYRRERLSVDDCLAKNAAEVERWHIDYLKNPLRDSAYFKEYLLPRYREVEAVRRAEDFLTLYRAIRDRGLSDQFPILVADVTQLNLGFRYFRFDGCHRLACCKVLGIETVAALVFTAEAGR
jgi:hypothetical protein